MSENQESLIGLAEAARLLGLQSNSLRARLHREGAVWGVRARRAPNNRILFRADEIRALIRVE